MAANNKQKRKAKRAQSVLKMLENYDKLLSSILIGNTIVNITASALAAVLFFNLFGARGVSLATAALTLVVLLFCEISPKTLAKESPESTALRVAPFMRMFIFLFTPLNYLTGVWKKVIVKVFPIKGDRSLTEDELLTFVEEVRQEGGINQQEEEMIRHVIEFDDLTAAEIITPRVDVVAISETSTPEEVDRVFTESSFSRLPVFRENIDNITGIITLKDFHLEVLKKGRPLLDVVKPLVFVTKTMKISSLLKTMQQKQSHMAVLVDEFGGTLGIVSMEDIVEELVGEIWDEHEQIVEQFWQNADGTFSVLGNAKFQDMLEYINNKKSAKVALSKEDAPPEEAAPSQEEAPLDTDGDAPSEEDVPNTTVGNWVLETAGSLPRAKEEFTWRNLRITVARVQRHRVIELLVVE
jgi:CBS domain containing-hemolysin-like protein